MKNRNTASLLGGLLISSLTINPVLANDNDEFTIHVYNKSGSVPRTFYVSHHTSVSGGKYVMMAHSVPMSVKSGDNLFVAVAGSFTAKRDVIVIKSHMKDKYFDCWMENQEQVRCQENN